MPTDRDFRYDLRPALQPLLLPVGALTVGVAAGALATVPGVHAMIVTAAAFGLGLAARWRGHAGLAFAAMLVAIAVFGCWRVAISRSELESRPIRRLVDSGRIREGDALQLVGVVEDVPESLPSAARMGLRVSGLRLADGEWVEATGRATIGVRIHDEASAVAFWRLGLERGVPVRVDVVVPDDQAFRNPGVETLRTRIRVRGWDLAARVDSPEAIFVAGPSRGCPILRWLSASRIRGLAEIDAAFQPRTAGVLRALLLGDESRLDEVTAEDYRRSGAYHVLVISGAHVALLAGLCVWICGRATRSPWLRLAAAAGPAWAYALLLGGPAPVIRAALALTVAFAASVVGRRAPPPNTLALAAGVVLVVDPSSIRDPSFQLTFAAVATIVCLAAPLVDRMAGVGRWRPHRASPYPPVCSSFVRVACEVLFWDERRFRTERRGAEVQSGAPKHALAVAMSRIRLQGAARRIAVGLWIAVAVQMALAPITLSSFGRVTLAGTMWALAVEALLGLALVAGLVFLLVCAVAPAASSPVAWIADRFVSLANDVAANAPDGWPTAAPNGWLAVALWTAPVAAVVLAMCVAGWHPVPLSRADLARPPTGARWRLTAAILAAVLVAAPGVPMASRPADGLLHVLFLDVGQGDAAFVRFPDGTTMLIDAGGRRRFDEPLGFDGEEPLRIDAFEIGERVVCASLLAQGISRVDWLVATHGDVDHVGGFGAVLRRLSVGHVVIGAGPDDAERKVVRSAAQSGVPVVLLEAGEAFEFGGARLDVVWPTANAPTGNDGSLVFRIVYGDRSFLFPGDLEQSSEASLLRLAAVNGWAIRADVLKVPHHGSRGASSADFVAAVGPTWAVVPAPRRSPYGHPHFESLQRLRGAGAMVLQTGIDGAVGFTTNGREIEVRRIAEPGTQLLPTTFDHGAR